MLKLAHELVRKMHENNPQIKDSAIKQLEAFARSPKSLYKFK